MSAFNFHWFAMWGLGFAFDTLNVMHPEQPKSRHLLCGKVFLGPLLISYAIPVSRWKPELY